MESSEGLISQEKIKDGIWRPAIFDRFKGEVFYGGSTKSFKEEIGIDSEEPSLKLLSNPERLSYSMIEKRQPARFLINLLERIDPEADPHEIVKTQLKHGSKVIAIDEDFLKLSPQEKIKTTLAIDGLITDKEHIPLYITAADCTPVAVYDPRHHAIGLFHSGWRGTADLISVKGIKKMEEKYGTRVEDIVVSIGPSIKFDHFEVDTPVYKEFAKNYSKEQLGKLFRPIGEKYLLNIPEAIRLKLLDRGVRGENIEQSAFSTTEDDAVFPSARKSGGIQNIDASVFLISLA